MADMSDDLVISISTDLAQVRRSLKRLETDVSASTGAIEKRFQSVGRGINESMTSAMQQRIDTMVGIGTKAAKEWNGVLGEQGKELERLRTRYSPLFATINSYKNTVNDIRRAHALGAISADEMTSAIARERQAALAATAAIKGRNQAIQATVVTSGGSGGANSFNTSNLAAQGFDIAATAAFMPWYTVALQQGPQVAQVFNDIRGSGAAIGPAVAGAFMQILNPVSLVTIGVIGASAALIQYLAKAGDVKTADEILKGHAETVALLKDRYGEAAEGLREYVNEGISGTTVDIRGRLRDAYKAVTEEISAKSTYSNFIQPYVGSTDAKIVADYRNAFIELRASIRDGKPDIISFREEMARIADNPDVPEAVRKLAEEMRKVDPEVLKVARSIPGMIDQLSLIEGTADRQAIAIGRLSTALRELSEIGVAPLDDIAKVEQAYQRARSNASNREERDDADSARRAALLRIDNRNPTVINSDGNTTNVPIPGQKPVTLGDKPPKEKAARVPRKTANDNFTNDLQSIRDRTAALAQEMQLIGLSNEAQISRRTALDLEQRALEQLREEARRKGQTDLESIKLSPDKIAAINKEAEAYARQAEALRVAQENNELVQSVTKGFVSDMMNGVKAADAFANALGKIADKLIDDVLNSILQVNSASGGGGGLLGSIFGGLFGGGGFKANTTFGEFIGAREKGGPVRAGQPYIVGEKRPELFVPNQSGVIVPRVPELASRSTGGGVSVSMPISIDATGADSAGLARVERQLAKLKAELPSTIVANVKGAQRRNVKI